MVFSYLYIFFRFNVLLRKISHREEDRSGRNCARFARNRSWPNYKQPNHIRLNRKCRSVHCHNYLDLHRLPNRQRKNLKFGLYFLEDIFSISVIIK